MILFDRDVVKLGGCEHEVVQLVKSMVIRNGKDGRLGIMEKNESVDDLESGSRRAGGFLVDGGCRQRSL